MKERIAARLADVGIAVEPEVLSGCVAYIALLVRWNLRMNLTALPLTEPIPDSTLDKLVVEPLMAMDLVPDSSSTWVDLGSGGGSPAIPLRLAHRQGFLRLVESRERKCAFLREVVRSLELSHSRVDSVRFEALTLERPIDLLTIRAVRLDAPLLQLISSWVRPSGILMCFGGEVEDPAFSQLALKSLPDGSFMRVYRRA
jgi:16S rRNA (guanine527-N7)-methyltransferase